MKNYIQARGIRTYFCILSPPSNALGSKSLLIISQKDIRNSIFVKKVEKMSSRLWYPFGIEIILDYPPKYSKVLYSNFEYTNRYSVRWVGVLTRPSYFIIKVVPKSHYSTIFLENSLNWRGIYYCKFVLRTLKIHRYTRVSLIRKCPVLSKSQYSHVPILWKISIMRGYSIGIMS